MGCFVFACPHLFFVSPLFCIFFPTGESVCVPLHDLQRKSELDNEGVVLMSLLDYPIYSIISLLRVNGKSRPWSQLPCSLE